jgi:hypothetical protein
MTNNPITSINIPSIENTINYFKIFEGFPLVAVFSSRPLNFRLDSENLEYNLDKFLMCLGISYKNLVYASQIHSTNILQVNRKDGGTIKSGIDGFITNSEDIAISVFTADCLSVFVYDKKEKAVGIIHVGWRNAKDNIVSKLIMMMQEKFGSQRKDLLFAFGPAIRSCCYEIGPELEEYFQKDIEIRNNKLYLDLARVSRRQLLECGIEETQIEDSNICTSCSVEKFFSWRREGEKTGRMISLLMLRKERDDSCKGSDTSVK